MYHLLLTRPYFRVGHITYCVCLVLFQMGSGIVVFFLRYIFFKILWVLFQMGNKGAFIRFEAPTMEPKIVTFSAVVSTFYFCQLQFFIFDYSCVCVCVYIYNFCFNIVFLQNIQPHPDVKPMAYASNFLRMFS